MCVSDVPARWIGCNVMIVYSRFSFTDQLVRSLCCIRAVKETGQKDTWIIFTKFNSVKCVWVSLNWDFLLCWAWAKKPKLSSYMVEKDKFMCLASHRLQVDACKAYLAIIFSFSGSFSLSEWVDSFFFFSFQRQWSNSVRSQRQPCSLESRFWYLRATSLQKYRDYLYFTMNSLRSKNVITGTPFEATKLIW